MQRGTQTVIVPTSCAVISFKLTVQRLGGFKEVCVSDVLARIVATLNAEGWRLGALEDMTTEYVLEGTDFAVVDEKILRDTQVLKGAIVRLGIVVRDQFQSLGMLRPDGGYGYFYNRLLGNDLVVTRYPGVETRDDNSSN